MSRKPNKQQRKATRHQSATSPTQAATLVKAPPQPVLVATPVLSPQANGHREHTTVHQDAPRTPKITKGLQQPVLVAAPVLSPKAESRDAHGRFLAKKAM